MKTTIPVALFLWIIQFALLSCDAPRNNPLDPENPENPYTFLHGRVESLSRNPLARVTVYWAKGDASVKTDSRGGFHFDYLLPENGWIFFEKEGFHRDSALVNWGTEKELSIEHFMDALPVLENLEIYSIVLNTHPANKEFYLAIRTTVDDPDSGIDSVFWKVPDLEIGGFLQPAGAKIFELTFRPELPNEEIVGHDFIIIVKNPSGRKTAVGTKQIKRVIKEDIVGLSPSGGTMVSTRPTLEWQSFNPGFHHTYRLEVYKDVQFSQPELVWAVENLPETLTSYTVNQELEELQEPDIYFWVIWAIDEFQNRARSKPLTFNVSISRD